MTIGPPVTFSPKGHTMHPNTIKPYINMMLFSMRHDLTGTAFVDCTEGLFNLIAQALEPFGCTISPYKSKVIDTVHRWSTEVIGPILQGGTSVRLMVEIVPWANQWQVLASFNPGTGGHSDIFDALKPNNISGDGFVYHLVHNIAHKANIRLVKDRLTLDQKVTISTESLYQALPGNQGSTKYTEDNLVLKLDGNPLEPRCTLFTMDIGLKQLASHLDELTVVNVSEHGYVTLCNPVGDQFMLNADEAISAIPELQI